MSKTETPNGNDDRANSEVGYGRPPVQTRFKPGQSGNPKGRPKGVRNFGTDVKATLKAPVKVTRDGKPRRVSTQEAMLLRLREKALGGDARALDRLIHLAQAYNSEDLAAAASVSSDDAMLLELYAARVMSGAAGQLASAEASQRVGCKGSSEDSPLSGSTDLGGGVGNNAKRKRVRLRRPRSPDGTT